MKVSIPYVDLEIIPRKFELISILPYIALVNSSPQYLSQFSQLNLLFDGKGIVAGSGMDSLLWFLFNYQGDFRFPKSLLVSQEKLE